MVLIHLCIVLKIFENTPWLITKAKTGRDSCPSCLQLAMPVASALNIAWLSCQLRSLAAGPSSGCSRDGFSSKCHSSSGFAGSESHQSSLISCNAPCMYIHWWVQVSLTALLWGLHCLLLLWWCLCLRLLRLLASLCPRGYWHPGWTQITTYTAKLLRASRILIYLD